MRDAQALEVELRIKDEVRTEVGHEQPVVNGGQRVEGQGLPGFLPLMDDLFELGEHGLPVDRAPQVVDLAVEEVGAHLRVIGLLEQMMGQEFLVEGRGDFGEEDRIMVILESLRALRIPRVHRVPGLVGQGEQVGKNVRLVVHQDVGR